MGLYQRLKDLLTLPDIETARYECTNCGTSLDSEADACPECGGEMAEQRLDPSLEYWDPMM